MALLMWFAAGFSVFNAVTSFGLWRETRSDRLGVQAFLGWVAAAAAQVALALGYMTR